MTAAAELLRIVGARDALNGSFQTAWRRLPRQDGPALEDWAGAALELLRANAGAGCSLAFWSASASGLAGLSRLASNGRSAAQVCREAGARAALRCLEALPAALVATAGGQGLDAWQRGLERLAREAADCVAPVAALAQRLLADGTGAAFSDFVAAGLKAHPNDAARRLAFFSLQDPRARALLVRRADVPGFESLSPWLAAYVTAIWGDGPTWQAAPPSDAAPRASLAGRVVVMPAATRAETASESRALYLAMAAHACAHLAQPSARRPIGPLKPMQVVLIGLVEDARVEASAMRDFPGLRRVWAPFHVVPPQGPRIATNLMSRLSRALFDPLHEDADGFVCKGRAMFAEEAARGLHDPELSLRIGRLLGHDLGQMRVQFDWRDYVVEPAYRDDGAHLWDPSDSRPAAPLDLMTEAADGRCEPHGGTGGAGGRAREIASEASGFVIATYPEWDAAAGMERPDWTTLRDVPARVADLSGLRASMQSQSGLRRRIAALVQGAVIGRPARLRRRVDGDDIDMDAAIDAMIAMRAGHPPDLRLFRVARPRSRDLATLVMLDASASTAARLPDGSRVLDAQVLALSLLAEALDARGDTFALRAFASAGRDDVRLIRLKEFDERFDDATLRRLAAMRPELSTRLGAALRHARSEFKDVRAWRRLLLVLTDGEPSDVDVADAGDLVVDSRRAVLALRHAGVDVFGVVLDPDGVSSAEAIFGPRNTIPMRDLVELPARLAGLYFRLTRR